jgi:hypothetical protein
MGTGIVFVYLLIAALVAPLIWLLWWALDLFVTRPARPVAAPRVPRSKDAAYTYPVAADVALPTRRSAVTVFSAKGTEMSTCPGPDAAGRCPRALADGTVPCAGHLLALPRPIRGSFEWAIPAGYQTCLLGSYDVYRQKVPAAGF